MIMRIKMMALAMLICIATSSAGFSNGLGSSNSSNATSVGKVAPGFRLRDFQGNQVDLAHLRGKVVVIDFWASWCGPCRFSMPQIEKLHRQYKDQGLVVLGINLEEIEDARVFLAENSFTFRMLSDPDGRVAEMYRIEAIPTMFVIGRDGKIVAQHVGVQSEATLRADLAKAGLSPDYGY